MPDNGLGDIGLFQILHLVRCQLQIADGARFVQALEIGAVQADDGDAALAPDPAQRHLTHLPPFLLRHLLHAPVDGLIGVRDAAAHGNHALRARRLDADGFRQQPGGQGTPGDQADAGLGAELVHLALLLAVAEVVAVLHADELGPAVFLGEELQARELVGPHGAGADVVHLAALDEVVQRFHRLFGRHGGVVPVDLEEVDVFRSQALERGIDRFENRAA